jgi:protein-disulfide isomerase
MGITGTPGFILGNQEIAGAVPYSQFQTAIDALLK